MSGAFDFSEAALSSGSWATTLTLAEAGKGCNGLFGLYDSLGDRTAAKGNPITGAYTVPTVLDGPEKVVRFGELEIGNGSTLTTFTASQRCKGLVILCDKLTVTANATLHMTGKGARVDRADDPFFPFINYQIPFKIGLSSSRMSLANALAIIKEQGLAPWDQGTFQMLAVLLGFNLSVPVPGTATLMAIGGHGAGAAYRYSASVGAGNPGSYGVNGGMGGGGGGGTNHTSGDSYHGPAGKGCPYSGGSGGGGTSNSVPNNVKVMPTMFSGPGGKGGLEYQILNQGGYISDNATQGPNFGGGGAGNPGGIGATQGPGRNGEDGTGGKLTIICKGLVKVNTGSPVGKIEANGMKGGGSQTYGGGGGSGGGHISIISPVAVDNQGTIQCAGGVGGANIFVDSGTTKGGDGGKGSVGNHPAGTDKFLTFSEMGW